MLDATLAEPPVIPRGTWLDERTVLVAWPHPARDVALRPLLGARALPRPSAFQATPEGDWWFALLRLPDAGGGVLRIDQQGAIDPLPLSQLTDDAPALIDDLPQSARAAFLSLLLGPGLDAFGLGRLPAFVGLCRALACGLVPAARLLPLARLGDHGLLVMPPRGAAALVAITGSVVQKVDCRAGGPVLIDGQDPRVFLVRLGPPIRILAVTRQAALPHAASLLARSGCGAQTLDRSLATLARGDHPLAPLAGAAWTEARYLAPRPAATLGSAGSALSARLDAAIDDHGGGLFLAGRLRDPLGLVAGARLRTNDGSVTIPRAALLPVALPASGGRAPEESGFALHLADAGRAGPQPAFALVLTSGAELRLTPPPWAGDAAAARDRILGAIPLSSMTPSLLQGAVVPAVSRLHRAHLAGSRAPEVVRLGQAPTRPRLSAIVPLYRNLSFLRTQLAALAGDPDWAEAETILVLDSPWQRREVEHLLRGIHLMHGLPITLAIMPRNLGYAAANNAGAALARAPHLLLLNSDVVPDAPGWLGPMLAALEEPGVRLAGPKLLFDDGGIQHAGLHFAQDGDGVWYNRHYFKGMPRHHAPANAPRLVPGVTGAAMLIDAASFATVGGLNEDYVIGDYEDSDLCLRLRCAGHEIAYVPAAELWHFERRSIASHAAHAGGCASLLNRDLHDRRWASVMSALTARFDA